jgi:L-lactate dehydrogenase complex protein LldG
MTEPQAPGPGLAGRPGTGQGQGSQAAGSSGVGGPGMGQGPAPQAASGTGGSPRPGHGTRERVLGRVRAAIGDDVADRQRRVDAEYATLPRDYLAAHHEPPAHDIVALFAERAADYRAVVERVPASALPGAIARVLADRAATFEPATAPVPEPPPAPPAADSMITKDPGHIEPQILRDHGEAADSAAGDGAVVASRAAGASGTWDRVAGREDEAAGREDEAAGREDEAAGPQFIVPQGLPTEWLARCAEECPQAALVTDDPPLDTALLDAAAGVVTGCAVAIAETGTIVLDHGPGQGRRAVTLVPDFHLVVVRHDQVAADLPGAFARLDPARPHTLISGPSATSDIELVRVEGVHGPRTLHVLIADPG